MCLWTVRIEDEELFDALPKEKQLELIGKKDYFAKKADITP